MAKKEKVKLNKYAWTGLIITIVALVCFVILLVPTKKEKFYETYHELNADFDDEDHVFKEISLKKMKRVVKNKSDEGYVYVLLGSETTSEFYDELDEINQIAKEKSIDTLYYLNYSSLDDDDREDLKNYLRDNVNSETVKTQYLTVKYITYSPDVLVFKDGKLVDRMFDIHKNDETSDKSVTWMLQNYIFNK